LLSAFLCCTAKVAELRPPRPGAELPPDSGPMKAILTVSFAAAVSTLAMPSNIAPHSSDNNLRLEFIVPCSFCDLKERRRYASCAAIGNFRKASCGDKHACPISMLSLLSPDATC
jgi:hypothetical protein